MRSTVIDAINLKTDKPVTMQFANDTTLLSAVTPGQDGEISVKEASISTTTSIDISSVKGITLPDSAPVKITAIVNVGIIQESGNSDADTIRLDGNLEARTTNNRYGIGGEFNQQETAGITSVDNWNVNVDFDHFLAKKWFWYGRALWEHDEFGDLELRSTLGTGAGYQVFESDTLNLSFSLGPAYVSNDYIIATNNSYPAAQWKIKYDQYFFDKFLQLFHASHGYVSFDDSKDWIAKSRQGVRFPIHGGFTGTLQYNYDYTNEPSPEAIAGYDSTFTFLLGYNFNN